MSVVVEVDGVRTSASSVPSYSRDGDAGLDLRSAEDLVVPSGGTVLVRTGFFGSVPSGFAGLILSRSGLASRGVFVTNGPGLVDSNFRGEWCVLLTNLSGKDFWVSVGDRVAQFVVVEVPRVEFVVRDGSSGSVRGGEGFGSSGVM
jgi:dUTP pyrophosphatase